jgi:hypothetical protein
LEGCYERLEKMLVKYQEQPLILSPHVEEMVLPLMGQLEICIGAKDAVDGQPDRLHIVCRVLQLICRVRGHKHVSKFFPHEVFHLEGCLLLLQAQDKTEHTTWETRYVLLLWLTVLCLIPFDICSLDSSMQEHTTTDATPGSAGHEGASSLVSLVKRTCQEYLEDAGPTREAAASCLSALLTRPDMDSSMLSEYITWTLEVMDSWILKGEEALNELTNESFRLLGMLSCLAKVFKTGHREKILPHAGTILGPCLVLYAQPNQVATRKLLTKLCQRLGTTFLPPRVAKWRYQRGNRSLASNLKMDKTDAEMPKQYTAGGDVGVEEIEGKEGAGGEIVEEEDNDDGDDDVPLELDDIIEVLLTSLMDKDTVVRWSAAKGLGRITMRLPEAFGDDVVVAILELFEDEDDDSSWHGGCLCLAELARRGLLLPGRLLETVPLICSAIHFDVLRGQHSVGSHVRDAACYVCWAFARAYSPEVMRPYVSSLSEAMLLTAVYDREINCRRAASAAFQENVGRQGNQNFPNGIEIITIADYFSLGNRAAAYSTIAPAVAGMADWYVEPFVDYLISSKVGHWDKEIRVLAGKGIADIVPLNPQLVLSRMNKLLKLCVSARLANRHGATLAVAEVVLSLASIGADIPTETADRIVGLISDFSSKRLYRGRGGEMLRQAAALLIENIARASLPLSIKVQVQLVEVLNENMRQPHEYIQLSSAHALRHFLFHYFPVTVEKGPSERLEELTTCKYLDGLKEAENAAVARGYALAMGALPAKFLLVDDTRLEEVFSRLGEVLAPEHTVQGEPDAETRRNAVQSLVELCERLMPHSTEAQCTYVVKTSVEHLLVATKDYSIDKRGDIGSWCRIEALRGMERVVMACERRARYQHNKLGTVTLGGVVTTDRPVSVGNLVFTCVGEGVVTSLEGELTCVVSFAEPTAGAALMAGSARFKISTIRVAPWKETTGGDGDGLIVLRMEDTLEMIKTILKQVSEKLDAVREVAGNVLRNLVTKTDSKYSHIPERDLLTACSSPALVEKYGNSLSELDISWSHPGDVFPFVVYLMDASAEYSHAIVSGTIISVGGMTETVVRESARALTHWCASLVADDNKEKLLQLAASLQKLLTDSSGDDRIIIPLLKCLELLLREGSFGSSMDDEGVTMNFLTSIKGEMQGCGDVQKLMACINVVVHLIAHPGPVRYMAMKSLLFLLGHKYPRIRKYTAEHLYMHFIADPDMVGKDRVTEVSTGRGAFLSTDTELAAVSDLLVETVWDKSTELARKTREDIYGLMQIDLKVKKRDTAATSETKEDELDSYAALVAEVGY